MNDHSRKLDRMEENLRELARFQETTLADLEDNRKIRWGLRYGIMETVQVVIDLACTIVRRRNLGDPDQPADCFRLLQQNGVLSNGGGDRLIQTIDARDAVVSVGQEVDDALILDALDRLSDFRTFANEIRGTRGTLPPAGDA